jgi:hypothetical protein
MLAGGMTIAAPSMMVPEAAAAGKLYVSAENAMFENTFGGAQIIEVVIIDSQRDETDEIQGEPVVKVDENQLRMAQAVDGNWYAYFGDSTAIAAANGESYLDFGDATATDPVDGDFDEAVGTYKSAGQTGATPSTVPKNFPVLSNYNNTVNNDHENRNQYFSVGQIGITTAEWPIIQTYDLTIENFDVVFEQAGADEVVSLNFDSADLDDYASLVLDRNSASQESDIHLVITDNQLNIDPTAEDIVSFLVATDAEGVSWMNRTINSKTDAEHWSATDYKPYSNDFDDNGKLIINNATAGSVILTPDATLDDTSADQLVIFFEGGENSGIFYNTDDDDDANIDVDFTAKRGFTATFDYNDSAQSFVVANGFGVLTMDASSVGDVWNSGEALTVTLIDQDLNKNSASDEDLVFANTTNTQLIPALQIGSPLSIDDTDAHVTSVQSYSKIAFYTNATERPQTGTAAIPYLVNTGYTGEDLAAMYDASNTYFNYNTVSFGVTGNSTDAVATTSLVTRHGDVVATEAASSGIVEISASGITNAGTTSADTLWLNVTKAAAPGNSHALNGIPIVADVFSFGENTNNAIYRILLEETDDNSATFEGSIEYMMLNQINIDLDSSYTGLATIDQDVDIIIEQDMTDEDSPRVNYYDLGADGVVHKLQTN